MAIPDMLDDFSASDQFRSASHKKFQERELLRRKRNHFIPAHHLPTAPINLQVGILQLRPAVYAAPDQRPYPGMKLRQGKGFRKIIIRTGVQTLYQLAY